MRSHQIQMKSQQFPYQSINISHYASLAVYTYFPVIVFQKKCVGGGEGGSFEHPHQDTAAYD